MLLTPERGVRCHEVSTRHNLSLSSYIGHGSQVLRHGSRERSTTDSEKVLFELRGWVGRTSSTERRPLYTPSTKPVVLRKKSKKVSSPRGQSRPPPPPPPPYLRQPYFRGCLPPGSPAFPNAWPTEEPPPQFLPAPPYPPELQQGVGYLPLAHPYAGVLGPPGVGVPPILFQGREPPGGGLLRPLGAVPPPVMMVVGDSDKNYLDPSGGGKNLLRSGSSTTRSQTLDPDYVDYLLLNELPVPTFPPSTEAPKKIKGSRILPFLRILGIPQFVTTPRQANILIVPLPFRL